MTRVKTEREESDRYLREEEEEKKRKIGREDTLVVLIEKKKINLSEIRRVRKNE
ncbi:hypothetical protein CSUI_002719 [Cystoisospora suis]|uniref:Uncharacterized protein n=1 Tax=Cystoisospora suis TaxID=483139 RepID=A0A2C6L5E6_9APIC|nr:hypothetical protein CSUI_002719 [Cystoisospora suis]